MKVLIFGGSGFIGKHLIPKLLNEGYEIIAFSRSPGSHSAVYGHEVRWVKWDSENTESVSGFFQENYSIINLAGESIGNKPWTKNQKEKILSSRLHITRSIAKTILASPVKPHVMIQGSAIGYYGSQKDTIIDETSEKGEGFLTGVVDTWEKSLGPNTFHESRVVFLRTGIVLGVDGGTLPLLILPFKFFAGGYSGNGKQWFSWIHIEDAINAIAFLLKNDKSSGIYNLTAPEPVQMKKFVKYISGATGKPSWLNIPEFLLKLLPGGMAEELLLTSQRVVPARLLKEGFRFKFSHAEEALNNLLIKKGHE